MPPELHGPNYRQPLGCRWSRGPLTDTSQTIVTIARRIDPAGPPVWIRVLSSDNRLPDRQGSVGLLSSASSSLTNVEVSAGSIQRISIDEQTYVRSVNVGS